MAPPAGIHSLVAEDPRVTPAPDNGRACAPCTRPFPTATLDRIAAGAGVSASSLSVLEVAHGHPLFTAILDYAGRYPRGAAGAAPPPPRALWINRDDDAEWEDPDGRDRHGEGEGDGNVAEAVAAAAEEHGLAAEADAEDPVEAAGRALGESRRPSTIKVVAGLGETVITWPPPPAMSVAALRAAAAAAKGDALGGPKPPSGAPAVATGSSAGEGDPPPAVHTIHVVHYATGPPVADQCEGAVLYRAVLLVCAAPDGEAALVATARGVASWQRALYARVPRPLTFVLMRFKTDRDSSYGNWEHEGEKHGRLLSSVVLPEGMAASLLADVRSFLSPSAKGWYARHGLPYRRSYLFHGTPGSGKTSTIRALASTFGLTACFLSITNASFNNQVLGDALDSLPRRALLVIEDVDALFRADRTATRDAGAVTFSGLLNCLDGLTAAESVLVALTTNKAAEELDPALVRGGRVDRRWAFTAPTASQLGRLFLSYYPDAGAEVAAAFADALIAGLGREGVSMAAAQQLFIHARLSTAAECLDGVPAFCAEYRTGRATAAAEAAADAAAAAATAAAAAAANGEAGGDADADGESVDCDGAGGGGDGTGEEGDASVDEC